MRYVVVILAAVVMLLSVASAEAQGMCLTREEAITVIAHKADVERAGRLDKALVWAIADRESGLRHCDGQGRVKMSATGDHGLLQLNENGVYGNCNVNPYCREPKMIDDPYVQIDIILNYFDLYGDLCPWNPNSNYMPGCGYGKWWR